MNSQEASKRLRQFRACDYCRRRKIRCGGQKPTCNHCRKREQTCHYSHFQLPLPKPKQPRVTTYSHLVSSFSTHESTLKGGRSLLIPKGSAVGSPEPWESLLLSLGDLSSSPSLSLTGSTPTENSCSSISTCLVHQLTTLLSEYEQGVIDLPSIQLYSRSDINQDLPPHARLLLKILQHASVSTHGPQPMPTVWSNIKGKSSLQQELSANNNATFSHRAFCPTCQCSPSIPLALHRVTLHSNTNPPLLQQDASLLQSLMHDSHRGLSNTGTLDCTGMAPWLLAGTTAGLLAIPSFDQIAPLFTSPLSLPCTSLTSPTDKLFHSVIIRELLHRYCQRIYPVLGRLYYQRLMDRLDRHLVPKSMVCSILAFEATYSDHPTVRRKLGYEACLIYHKRARLAVTENLEGCTMDDVVALILMGDNEAALGSFEVGDFYFTAAVRLGQRLGLHLTDAPGPQCDVIDTDLSGFIPEVLRRGSDRILLSTGSHLTLLRETKRIVWWQAYFYQILYSLTFGTSPAVNPDEVYVSLPNQGIKLAELNRLLLKEARDTMGTHRIYPSIYPEYSDIYPWISDEATMLKLQYRVVDLSYKRKFNPRLWLDQLPQINQELDHWLTELPYTKYPELFSSVGSGQGDGLGGHVIIGLLYLRFAEFYAMRIRINTISDLPNLATLDDIVRTECRQRCWHTAIAVRDLLHRSKKLPIPCHNLSITGCLYLTASVCITEFALKESKPDRKRVAYEFLQEILDFLQIHGTYYPLNCQMVKELNDRIAPFL